jgi:hypothetical protein
MTKKVGFPTCHRAFHMAQLSTLPFEITRGSVIHAHRTSLCFHEQIRSVARILTGSVVCMPIVRVLKTSGFL